MGATPQAGSDREFQINPGKPGQFIDTALQLVGDGADMLLLEPAMFSADVLTELKKRTLAPLFPFSASGEYTTLSYVDTATGNGMCAGWWNSSPCSSEPGRRPVSRTRRWTSPAASTTDRGFPPDRVQDGTRVLVNRLGGRLACPRRRPAAGLTCQPCWDQLTALEKSAAKVKAAGIDQVVSITTDPADLITRKTKDMGLTTPVLSDPGLKVSQQYGADQYGMMGTSRDGHSFLLVGPDGTIRWRADYGGAPDDTMYVAVDKLLADLKAGVKS